ncbi:hypothetical protein ACFYXF_44530 [Streptomyces sp. NPDC002680]|uniref:hypothetical protein n=1 Tax=Streptomyces sp. NPDC002680 TaxID=3364659 RepID=UPI003678224C
MTATTGSRPRVVAAVGALLAGLVLALLPMAPATTPAAAADGTEDSALTLTGRKGAYDDFSDLKVTVHQTRNLRSQGVRVSWEGAAPTLPDTGFNANYLQIMQCWGDDPTGPTRDQCEYGTGLVPGTYTGTRRVDDGAAYDPGEKQYTGAGAFVPFRPATGKPATTRSDDYTYFSPLDSNEQAATRTFANGTGEVEFELQDGVQSDYLGCGVNTAPEGSTPKPRPCWLVVVPRGTHEANGREVVNPSSNSLNTSPLSATNWAQRLVFRLEFLPVDQFCPEGQPERPTVGSELVTDAVTSWQPKLCASTASTYSFNSAGEEDARGQVANTSSETPLLGFTVDPVPGAEGAPAVVHAPVAVSALAIAFFVEGPSGVVQEMRLNPRLVAKMLTHSYVGDVPQAVPTPAHVKGNPQYYTQDPEFQKLNPDFPKQLPGEPMSLVVPLGSSDTARLVWNWLQSDTDAREFLAGKKDPWGMRLNSYFTGLDKNTILNSYPKSDETRAQALAAGGAHPLDYGILDLAPYSADLHDGAVRARRGSNGRTIMQNEQQSPTPKLIEEQIYPGRHAVMAFVEAASAERYGLNVAALPNADGRFVKPSTDTLLAGVAAMRPSSENASVLKPDPARAKGQAYPLTVVTYAAASVNQDAESRKAYAQFIRFAAGSGQTPGLSAGQLPPGYAPLPTKLRQQAETAADDLVRGAVSEDPPADDPGSGDPGGVTGGANTGGDTSGGAAASGGTTGGSTAGGGDGSPTPSQSVAANGSPPPSSGPQQNVAESREGVTPGEILGIIRWVLLVVLLVGGAAGLSGPIMLYFAQRRTP